MQALVVAEVEVEVEEVAWVAVEVLRVEHVGSGQVEILVSMYGSLKPLGTLRCQRRDSARGCLGAIARSPSKA
jgi:hypothetical protein